jgi:hypothetical protein
MEDPTADVGSPFSPTPETDEVVDDEMYPGFCEISVRFVFMLAEEAVESGARLNWGLPGRRFEGGAGDEDAPKGVLRRRAGGRGRKGAG